MTEQRLLVERAGLIRLLKTTKSVGKRQVAARRVLAIDTEIARLRRAAS